MKYQQVKSSTFSTVIRTISALTPQDNWCHPANQSRSIELRDDLIEAGLTHLCRTELASLTIRELASACNVSVGAFYKRFTHKQGFLQTLQRVVVEETERDAQSVFSLERIEGMTHTQCIEEFVALMINIFHGRGRGVIRASYKGLGKDIDTWEPMRRSSYRIRTLLVTALVPKLNQSGSVPASLRIEEQLKFVYQVINGTLINELLNPWHVFTIENPKLNPELVRLALAYLEHQPNE